MDSKEPHQQNRNAAALPDPISTSQAEHNRSSVGALSLRQPQQPPLMLDASPNNVDNQQPSMQLGVEKRGRGSPRKYAPPDGGADAAANSSSGSDPPAKRSRGRPPASGNKQRRSIQRDEESITAHIIDVNAGEDIARKLVAFMNQEPRKVCILSASGAVSSAVIQSNTPLGVVTYEGLYDITHMSGTFLNTESDDDDGGATATRTGNLNVSLAGPDFMIVGGCVGGRLVAASQVQVIVGIYGPERVKLSAASSAPASVLSLSSGGGGPGLPQSQGPQRSSESSEGNASTSLGNSTPQPPHHPPLWPGNNPQ